MKIGLGSAQFGMDYGISNSKGITPELEVKDILEFACRSGISWLDTATRYEVSEEVLGRNIPKESDFKIVTKTPLFKKAYIDKRDAIKLKDTFLQSLDRLNKKTVYGLLIHHSKDLLVPGGHLLWNMMVALKDEGFIKKIGVSVYKTNEIMTILRKYPLDLVQIPISVFDQSMIQRHCLQRLKDHGVEIHSRSIFLQGLLLMDLEDIPSYFDPIRATIRKYHNFLKAQEIDPLDAALGFMYQQSEIDRVFVGVNTKSHLEAIVKSSRRAHRLKDIDFSGFSLKKESMRNPFLWRLS